MNSGDAIMYSEACMEQLTWECWLARRYDGLPNYRLRGWHKKYMRCNAAFMDGHGETVNTDPDLIGPDGQPIVNAMGDQLNINGWPVRNRRWTQVCGLIRRWTKQGGAWKFWADDDPWKGRSVPFLWYDPAKECR